MKITIIGAGNMGGAFARGLVSRFDRRELELTLSDHEDKHAAFKDLEVQLTSKNIEAVRGADIVILAVKPFDIENICREIAQYISEKSLILSIAAGVKIEKITAAISSSANTSAQYFIVRVMPNLPATIGESMSGWVCSSSVTPEQKNFVRKILQSIGCEIEVETEDMIDKVTAMSGSGPAYVWKFMESMISAGVKIGLSHEQSRTLTRQTFFGASKMASFAPEDVSTLRKCVTSKGGTTEQALRVFFERSFDSIVENAVKTAYERAKELGR